MILMISSVGLAISLSLDRSIPRSRPLISGWSRTRAEFRSANTYGEKAGMAKPRSAVRSKLTPIRCAWVGDKPHMIRYHDQEWGVPIHNDRRHFELLLLEGAQAGLTWDTILRKRAGYRNAFANFDPRRVARFTAKQKAALLNDPS